jgi:hypothetical protein
LDAKILAKINKITSIIIHKNNSVRCGLILSALDNLPYNLREIIADRINVIISYNITSKSLIPRKV